VTDGPRPLPARDLSGLALLRLARRDRAAARRALRDLPAATRLELVLDVRAESRVDLLMLFDDPREVVSHLPEAEFCVTARASGMSDVPWLLEMARGEQIAACFDLDCWKGSELQYGPLLEWLGVLVEAGEPTLLRATASIDPELLVLAVLGQADLQIVAREEIPPDGWFTIDGVVYFGPHERIDPASLRALVDVLFREAPERYWQIVYGVLFESVIECEEYALHWRTGRMTDLGFPSREEAMAAYRPLRPEQAPVFESGVPAGAVAPTERVPEPIAGTLIEEGLSKLEPRRAADILGYILAVANALAVADQLPLTRSESIPTALGKAVRGIERGLRELSRARGQSPDRILDTTLPLDLFRIGATLDPEIRPPSKAELEAQEPE
jgi:hypothetical protein